MEVLKNLQEQNQCQVHVEFEYILQQYKDYEEQQKWMAVKKDGSEGG